MASLGGGGTLSGAWPTEGAEPFRRGRGLIEGAWLMSDGACKGRGLMVGGVAFQEVV